MAGNSSSVYGTAQPLQGNVTDWVNGQEQMDFAYRDEARKEAEIKRLADARAQEAKDAQLERYNSIKSGKPTGLKSLDDAQGQWYEDAKDEALKLYKKQYSGQQLTPEESARYKKLESLPETVALMFNSYQQDAARYYEGVKSGKIKRDLDYELKLQQIPDKAVAFLDDDLNPAIGMDNDGDGKPDIISFDMNGLNLKPNYVDNIDVEEAIKSVSDNLDIKRNVTDSNYTKRTTEGLPLKVAKAAATGMVIGQDGSLTPLAKSYFYDSGVRDFNNVTPEQITKAETYFTDRLVNSKKSVNETDYDYNAANNANKEAKGKKEEKVPSLNDLQLTGDITVGTKGTADGRKNIGNVYQGNVDIKRKSGNAEEKFIGFDLLDDGSVNVTVDVAVPERTGSGADAERTGKVDVKRKTYNSKKENGVEVVNYFAQRFQDPQTGEFLKNASELKDKLASKGQTPRSEQEPQKLTIEGF